MSDKDDILQKATDVTTALNALGIHVSFESVDRKALGYKLVFKDKGASAELSKDALLARLDHAKENASTGKTTWIDTFKDYLSAMNDGNATIDKDILLNDTHFTQLLQNSTNTDKIKPIAWHLSSQGIQDYTDQKATTATGHDNLVNIAKALTSIAAMRGKPDLHFKVDETRTLTYYSTSADLAGETLDKAAQSVLRSAVATNSLLSPDGKQANEEGKALVSSMLTTKGHVTLDQKITGRQMSDIVNFIENKQIIIATELYLGKEDVTVRNSNNEDIYSAKSDGKPHLNFKFTPQNTGLAKQFSKAFTKTDDAKAADAKKKPEEPKDPLEHMENGVAEAIVIDQLSDAIAIMPVAAADASVPFTPPAGSKPANSGTKKKTAGKH